MNKDKLYEKAVLAAIDLQNSSIVSFLAMKGFKKRSGNNIAGVKAKIFYAGDIYDSVVAVDKEEQKVKVDINLMINAEYRCFKYLFSYLLTLNLLSEYDCFFRTDSTRDIHIFTELFYDDDYVPSTRELEITLSNLLEIMAPYVDVIRAIAHGRKTPVNDGEASKAFYEVLCDEETVILPCFTKKSLTQYIDTAYEPSQRYIKAAQPDEDQPDPEPLE